MRSYRHLRDEPKNNGLSASILIIAAFLIGSFLGSWATAHLDFVSDWAIGQFSQTQNTAMSFARSGFWQDGLLVAVVFLCGFFPWGTLAVPGVMLFKGMTLSIPVTAFVKTFGIKGYLPSFLTVFFSGFFVTACLTLLALQAVRLSAGAHGRPRGRPVRPDTTYYITAVVCVIFLVILAAVRVYLSPALVKAAFAFLT